MNFIWEPILQLQQWEREVWSLHFVVQNNRVSPYLELQGKDFYGESLTKERIAHLDVNPYVRFPELFERLLPSDSLDYPELKEEFADILLHFLADLDRKRGRSKREYGIRFLWKEMEQGIVCRKEEWEAFSVIEKRMLVDAILTLYETGEFGFLLLHVTERVFPHCQVLQKDKEEVVFYMREPETEQARRKLQGILSFFLPVPIPFVIHWEHTYGVVGFEETLKLGEFVI